MCRGAVVRVPVVTQRLFEIAKETMMAWNPDIIIVSCNNATPSSGFTLSQNGTWSKLQAAQGGQVHTVLGGREQPGPYLDGGPGAPAGLMQFASIIRPQYFNINVQNAADEPFTQSLQFDSGTNQPS